MTGTLETLDDDVVEEVIHGDRRIPLRVRSQRVPATDDEPAVAIERTTLPEGPTRPPVVLVHGFAQNRYTWRLSRISMSGYLAAAGYDVLNVELRGHGNSRVYGAGNARHFDDYTRDVLRVVQSLDAPAFLVGHSLGAAVCIAVATRAETRGLISIGGVYTFARYNRALRGIAKVSRRMERAVMAAPARVRTAWAGKVLGRLYRFTDVAGYTMPIAGWAPGSMQRDLLEERLALGFDWTSVEVWMQMAKWASGEAFPYAPAWRETDVPALIIAGDNDALVPPRDARHCYEDAASDDKTFIEFEPFEHRVHWGHIDLITGDLAPEQVWPEVEAWLNDR